MGKKKFVPKPEWLRAKSNSGKESEKVSRLMENLNLHTVCQEAHCPNCGECFGNKTATFMILGRQCTRSCSFCCVSKGETDNPDPDEPYNIAHAIKELNLKYAVITSVTRDDLPDGGSEHFANVINAIRKHIPQNTPGIEVLIPDFKGDINSLLNVINASPEVINHNLETVPSLYEKVRPEADYRRSLELLKRVKEISPQIFTKSGIMLGLGENENEVLRLFKDLREVSCDFLTIGQYLPPSKEHHPLTRYVTPQEFMLYRESALNEGFSHVASGPLVRSSYQAHEAWENKSF